jgi:polyphosphate kinase
VEPVYFNRELSWLAFNERVLAQAKDPHCPLLERMNFLAYVSSNLDEFFEIRVSGLIHQQHSANYFASSFDGLSIRDQLKQIHANTERMVKEQYECWQHDLVPALEKEGIFFKNEASLSQKEKDWLQRYFEREIFPILTPLAIDPAHPFPQLGNKTLNILFSLKPPPAARENLAVFGNSFNADLQRAIVPIPRILPRLIRIETCLNTYQYIFLTDVICLFWDRLFPGYALDGAWPFRITRNSDLSFDEEECCNLLQTIEEELKKRVKGYAVRLEIKDGVPHNILQELVHAINVPAKQVYKIPGPINLQRLLSVYNAIQKPHLKFEHFSGHYSPISNFFDALSQGDILLHHPYDSFKTVIDFVQAAAHDPQVYAIKMTLYRAGEDSPIVDALREASRLGKQVTVLIELKARFDEANNIQWARKLEQEGVHVVYGLVGLKTHCKCCLIVRSENGHLKRYVHLGTGNYNPRTAKTYTDISVLTAHEAITEEVAQLFNALTGLPHQPQFEYLSVAPFTLHNNLPGLTLDRERDA